MYFCLKLKSVIKWKPLFLINSKSLSTTRQRHFCDGWPRFKTLNDSGRNVSTSRTPALQKQQNTAMASFCAVTHVIFDLDGLILDTEKVYEAKYSELLTSYGKELTPEVRLRCLGRKDIDSARVIIDANNLPLTPQEFVAEVKKLFADDLANAPLQPGVERLARHLARCNVPIAVATSSARDSMLIKTTNHKDVMDLFHHIVTAGSDPEVKKGKPHPDIFLICASRFADNPPPKQCLVLEDAPNGVQGARAAGMQVVMVPESFIPPELTAEATLVLKSLEDFRPELFGLPKFPEDSGCQ